MASFLRDRNTLIRYDVTTNKVQRKKSGDVISTRGEAKPVDKLRTFYPIGDPVDPDLDDVRLIVVLQKVQEYIEKFNEDNFTTSLALVLQRFGIPVNIWDKWKQGITDRLGSGDAKVKKIHNRFELIEGYFVNLLVELSVSQKVNPVFSIFLLKNIAPDRFKDRQEITNKDLQMTEIRIIKPKDGSINESK